MTTESKKTASPATKKDAKKRKSSTSGPKGGIKSGVVTILFALIKMSGVGITEASGKLGGNVFSRTKGGAVLRNRVVGTNPQTIAQQSVRAIFGAISSAWRALSQAQRDAWNAITEDYPYQNRLGETKLLSGKALFQKLNNNLLYAGEDLLENPLSPQGVNAPLPIEQAFIELNAGGTALEDFEVSGQLANDDDSTTIVVLEATPPMSPGVKNANPRFVRLQQQVAAMGAYSFENNFDYVTLFGLPPVGSQIQVRVFSVNPNTGEKSAVTKESMIVTQA